MGGPGHGPVVNALVQRRAVNGLLARVAIGLFLVVFAVGGPAAKSASAVPNLAITLGASARSDRFLVEAHTERSGRADPGQG